MKCRECLSMVSTVKLDVLLQIKSVASMITELWWCVLKTNLRVSQSCASENSWRASEQSNFVFEGLATAKASKVWFSHSQLNLANGAVFDKFDCSVARQNFKLLVTAHDFETGLSPLHGVSNCLTVMLSISATCYRLVKMSQNTNLLSCRVDFLLKIILLTQVTIKKH